MNLITKIPYLTNSSKYYRDTKKHLHLYINPVYPKIKNTISIEYLNDVFSI